MKNFYLMMLLALTATSMFGQEEELIPGAVIGSCVEPDSNLITIFFDYSKNCPEADPGGELADAEILGFHSGINDWATIVRFDEEGHMPMTSLGNGIFMIKINTLEYYGSSLADIEDVHFLLRSADISDPWDYTCQDDIGGGGFGGDEPCNNFVLKIVNLPICSEVEPESSVSVLGPTTAANSCIDSTNNTVRLDFDLGLNCPEADPGELLKGAAELGFHSGANDWESQVNWDDDNAMRATNNGNDIFSVTVDPMAYYGVAMEDLENIVFLMNNGVANPDDPWTNTGKDDRDGGFGGAEPCSDLVFSVSEAGFCPVVKEVVSSESVISVTGNVATCLDVNRKRVRISFDLSKNCPEADSTNALAGVDALGFHSGANNFTTNVNWDADNAVQAVNDGNDVFTVTIDLEEYYGIPFDSIKNIEFVLNNGPENPDDPWSIRGLDPRDGGGFGGNEPCSNLILDLSEVSTCDLPDQLTSIELVSGLAASCVDMTNGKLKIEWDRNQNCPEADSTNMLGDTIVLHSGVNGWTNQVAFDAENSMKPVNDGNGLYSMEIDVQNYYGIAIEELNEVNFLFNNAVAAPDDPWAITGKTNKEGGGFGGDEPCDNFRLVISEIESCELSEKLSTQEIFSGLAESCVDTENGLIRIDFDRNQNCAEADSTNMLGDTIVLHSGVNNWMNSVNFDNEISAKPVNDGNGLYRSVIDPQAYWGLPLDSITEVNFLFNNAVANPDSPWDNRGLATTGMGGFGGDELCDNFRMVLSEAPSCDLSEKLSTQEIFSGLAESCVDTDNGLIRIDFDRNQNCAEADSTNMLGDTIVLHSGVNNWMNQVTFDNEISAKPVNDGFGLYRSVIDPQAYWGLPLDSITEVNFLFNNAVANPDSPWDNRGLATTGMGGFGGDELCDNFRMIISEAPACNLVDQLSSPELFDGLAETCVDRQNGLIRIDFDRNLNCAEADSTNLLGETIVLHSGINNWMNQVTFDNEKSAKPVNDGNGLYRSVIDPQAYWGVALDSVTEVNFLFNNAIADPDSPWTSRGLATTGMGGFGGDELCDNFRLVISEAPNCALSTTSTVDRRLETSMKVIPNPFSTSVLIKFDNPTNKRYDLMISDLSGRMVRQINGITSNQVRIERNELVAGMYFALLRDENGHFATAKLIVE